MFEAVVTLCLALEGSVCRDVLLPGYEAEARDGCVAALATRPPDIARFAPLVASGEATCVETGEALAVEEVAPGVFVHLGEVAEPDEANQGDVANLGFVVGDTGVAVVDTGYARWMGEALWRAIRARTDLSVTHVILTHMHPDHVLGASVLSEAGAEIVAHADMGRALADRRDSYLESLARLVGPAVALGTETVAVDIAVAGTATIDLGGRTLELTAWPVAHTGNDLTVRDVPTGTVFAGDLIFDAHTPTLDGSLRGWQAVLADLSAQDIARLVPGHGGPVLDWPEGGEPVRRYLDVLARDTRAAIAAGERLGDAVRHIAASEAPNWTLFEAYNPRNATVAFTELEWE